jgi:hypothetical protein
VIVWERKHPIGKFLEAYGRLKYRYLLPIYRLLGLSRNGAKMDSSSTASEGLQEIKPGVRALKERDGPASPHPQEKSPGPYTRVRSVPTREGSPIFYHRPHGRPCHGITHEVIEDFNRLCLTTIENPERARFSMPENLSLITCHNYNRKVLIEKCLEAYGIDGLVVLGKEIVEWDWSCKIRPVLAYLESGLATADYIVTVDSDDVLMVNNPANIIESFETYSCDVLFCNTFLNWPFNKEYGEFEALRYYTHQFHSHLSAGGYIGRRGALIEFLREILSAFEGKQEWAMEGGVFNDQLAWKHLHYKYYPRIKVDFRSLIFKRYDLFMDYD